MCRCDVPDQYTRAELMGEKWLDFDIRCEQRRKSRKDRDQKTSNFFVRSHYFFSLPYILIYAIRKYKCIYFL